MKKTRLCVVIHAEEEFDWHKGFYRSNTKVDHGTELIETMNAIISLGGKIVLAMDFPFVASEDGKKVIHYFKSHEKENVEFAAHLHPWVNPPFEDNNDFVSNYNSFPGNLAQEYEYNKLKNLTEKIEQEVGARPTSYLAGRYGIGKNTNAILKSLGYRVDLSISSYSDFSNIGGPNFIEYTNKIIKKNGITYIPHTCSMVAINRRFAKYINTKPSLLAIKQEDQWRKILSKLLRVKKYRLSPEGFDFEHMKQVTENQLSVGQEVFILSFHSPSVKLGGTPYVNSCDDLAKFKQSLMDYLHWFNTIPDSTNSLARSLFNK